MLNAEEARKLTKKAVCKAEIERVEKSILQAANEGKTSCKLRTSALSDEATEALEEGGYRVQVLENCSEIIINWMPYPRYYED